MDIFFLFINHEVYITLTMFFYMRMYTISLIYFSCPMNGRNLHWCNIAIFLVWFNEKITSLNGFSKAIEHAAEYPAVVEAIGVPIVRGPWYDASLEVGHLRRSVSCTFPVSGPNGSGFLQIKATRHGGLLTSFSFVVPRLVTYLIQNNDGICCVV